jgi:inosose dehydratase
MPTLDLTLATGPVSWGVDFADTPGNPPWQVVLDEVVAAGLGALELGPVGYMPEDPESLRDALAQRGLTAVGTFVFDDLHEPSRRQELLATTERTAAAIDAAGGELMVLIDRPSAERVVTAGRAGVAPRMPPDRWAGMVEVIEESAAIAADAGLRPVFHPHAGGWVEFEDEVERFLSASQVDLCLDLGHTAFAGIDLARAIDDWGERIGHLHLKDVDPVVLAQVRAEGLDFWQAIAADVFCPLGDGMVDLADVAARLAAAGYKGFATIEQDRVPGGGEPLADLRRSIAALSAAGFPVSTKEEQEGKAPG